jgi:glyoxylase-like metal-dependent hydrolase (beta-lactamase superfamily II)
MPARIAVLASLLLIGATPVAPPPASGLGKDIHLIRGGFEPGRQPDGNTVVFAAPEGLVVFDTGRHPEHGRKILEFASASRQPIAAVVNSHWHLDHVSGNPRLRAQYPQLRVYASGAIDGAMHGFLANSKQQALQFLAQPDLDAAMQAEIRADIATIDSGKAVYPDVVIDAAGEREFGGRNLQVGFERAATEGDLWLYDAQSRTLASGDLVTLPVPFLDTACPARWSLALEHLQAVPFETLVPGHGEPMDRTAFATWRKAFDGLLQCAASDADKSACRDGWFRDAAPLLPQADRDRVGGLLDYYIELLRDQPKIAAACGR